MKGTRLTGWRKIANTIWNPPNDPQIFGMLELDATPVLEIIDHAKATGRRITPTHLVARAVSRALVTVPALNVRLLGNRAISRESVDVFVITSVAKARDLSGVKISNIERKGVLDVAKELDERCQRMDRGDDPDFARSKRAMVRLPRPVLRTALRFGAWLAGDRDKSLPWLGITASPFGSAMISSVGMLGLPAGFAPLAWMYRVPLLVLVGEIVRKPVAVAGRVEIRPVLPITVTVDHRYVDGAQLGEALTAFREYLAAPAVFEWDFTDAVHAPAGADHHDELHDATARLAGHASREFDRLRRMREELRLKIQVASAEAKAQWARLEEDWISLESDGAWQLLADLDDGYRRLRAALSS